MARTRRQVTLQEQESGIPASPPQSLSATPRVSRTKRTTSRNNAAAANNTSADPPPSTRGEPPARSGRIGRARKIGRGRTQTSSIANGDTPHDAPDSSATDVDGPEASDSQARTEVTGQATTATNVVNGHDDIDYRVEVNVESPGEIQFPTDASAHPVQVQDLTAHPVQGSTSHKEPYELATSLIFMNALKSSPQRPRSSSARITSRVVTPLTQLRPNSMHSSRALPSTGSSPHSSCPCLVPPSQACRFAFPTPVYYMPSRPEWSHSLITIRMDYFQGSKDPVRPSNPAAFAVPSELIAPLCRYIESRAKPGSDLSKLTTDHPAVNAIVHESARYRPQMPSWHSQQSPPTSGYSMRDAFIRKAQRKRVFREIEEETASLEGENARSRSSASGETNESPSKRTKIVPDPWTAEGKLILGRTKEIEVDAYGIAVNPLDKLNLRRDGVEVTNKGQHEESRRVTKSIAESSYIPRETPGTDDPGRRGLPAEVQDQSRSQDQPDQVPETPRTRGWGLSKFLPSARSVTKYIPFSSRRTPSARPSQPQQPAPTEPQVNANNTQPQREPQPDSQPESQPESQLEPRDESQHELQQGPDLANNASGPRPRQHQSTSNQQRLLTKQQSEEEKRIKKMRAQLRKEAEALEKQKRDLETARKDLEEQQKSMDVSQTPGQKRKRIPSPDVIPLPISGGFGMVDEFFIVESSSDEEDVIAQETPTKERPTKKARISTPNDAIIGSQFRARPYTGTLFAHPDASESPQHGNVFVESSRLNASPVLGSTPSPGPTLTFKVPSPGSSDSEDDDDSEGQEQIYKPSQEASSPKAPSPKSILRKSGSSQSQPRSTAKSTSPSKTLAPPPRPNPGHASLPAVTAIAPSDALEKAREKALKHQPKQPSTLRESSRLSSSTVNSDPGNEANLKEYDPANPTIVPSPSKEAMFGKSAHSKTPELGQPVVGATAPTGFQFVPQVVSKHPAEQPQTNGKRDSTGEPVVLPREQTKILRDTQQINTNIAAKVKADMDRWWEEHGDDYVLNEGYEDFQKDMLAEEQELMGRPNSESYHQPQNIISAALDRVGADGSADKFIQSRIESNWRPGDLERTEQDPANGMRVFFDRLVTNGDIEKDVADRAIAFGVPPGITEYLAGQEVMGTVAA